VILITIATIVHICYIIPNKKVTVCHKNTSIFGIIENTKVITPKIKEKIDPVLS
jgi:hypothetical protein